MVFFLINEFGLLGSNYKVSLTKDISEMFPG